MKDNGKRQPLGDSLTALVAITAALIIIVNYYLLPKECESFAEFHCNIQSIVIIRQHGER